MRTRRVLLISLLLLVALFVFTLPPRPRPTQPGPATPAAAPAEVRGAYHIHTTRSDGTGTVDEVAEAAARAGLRFIILTDHGDATRTPLPPSYRAGVLVIDAVEISTENGHYAALGLPGAAPYRLAGEARDVVEDVRRLGGFGIAAHPTSRKEELRWTGWDTPFDGLEWLNVDSEWRDESTPTLLLAFARYPLRPAATLASLFSHDRAALERWDGFARERRVIGMAAVDAHARIGLSERRDPYAGMAGLRVPSYESLFQTFTLHVELPRALTGDAADDARAVLEAIRRGRLYTVLDALATPGAMRFEATSGDLRARMGDFLPPVGGRVAWRASTSAPEGSTMRLVCDGRVVADVPATTLLRYEHLASAGAMPGACRIEVGWDRRGVRVLWLVTNPIYLRAGDPSLDPPPPPRAQEAWPVQVASAADWVIEQDGHSQARVTWEAAAPAAATQEGPALRLEYALRPGERQAQFVAAVTTRVDGIARSTRLRFRAWAEKPMRLSVQVRRPNGPGERWRRSVYVDATPRDYVVGWDDMRQVPMTHVDHPPLDQLHALLFVVDTMNTAPGESGVVRLADLRFER